MDWIKAARVSELQERGRALVRHGKRQLALFSVGDVVYAVDNRCPHEGYPLLQGSVDDDTCQLTCQWHNWKFELETGECVLGEDHVRSYPTRIEDDWVCVDVTDLPAETYRRTILAGVVEAVAERQYTRIAREVSRLLLRGLDPLDAVRTAVGHTYEKFEYGMTHAFAAAQEEELAHESELKGDRSKLGSQDKRFERSGGYYCVIQCPATEPRETFGYITHPVAALLYNDELAYTLVWHCQRK